MSKTIELVSFSVCHFKSSLHFLTFSNNQMGKRGKRFIPRITTVPEWSTTGPDRTTTGGLNGQEEPTLVIESPEKEILTIAQGETLFQIDSDNRIRLARLIELPQIDFSKGRIQTLYLVLRFFEVRIFMRLF